MPNYIAVVHKEPASDYGVSFPDFPGCVTAGKTIDEAKDLDHTLILDALLNFKFHRQKWLFCLV
jgi:HicB_like antitoxin of bacterial toxin-antitoxin system